MFVENLNIYIIMTASQYEKLKELGDKVLDYCEGKTGLIVVIMRYGAKRFCRTFIGVRGGMTYQECKVYKNYTKENGVTGFLFKEYN